MFPFALLLLVPAAFLLDLNGRDLVSSHEARAAQNARSILDDGAWVLPHQLDGRPDLQKPPLFYWWVALLGTIRGTVDGWAVRLPAAVSALGCCLMLFWFVLQHRGWRSAVLATLVLAALPRFTWLARVGRIDMPLTFALTAALLGFWSATRARPKGNTAWPALLLGYVAVAAGMLLKGPIAPVLIGLVLAALWIVERRHQESTDCRIPMTSLLWGLPLVLGLTLPWFLAAQAASDGRLFEEFFLHHNLRRGMGGAASLASYPFWYYVPRIALDLLPWSLMLPMVIWLRRREPHSEQATICPLERLGALWCLTIFLFLSCMSFKRADYLLPAYPGAALFLGCRLERWVRAAPEIDRGRRRWLLVLVLAAGTLVISTTYHVLLDPAVRQGPVLRRVAADIRARTSMPVIFFRTEAHALAFHVGTPLDTILEWENLDWWAARPETVCFVMSPDHAARWRNHLKTGTLHLMETVQVHGDRPLAVLRNEPATLPAR